MNIEIQYQFNLTDNEQRILIELCYGQDAYEIGRRCGKTPRTVNQMLLNIMAKLNARSLAHLVAIALAKGVITIDTP